MWDVLSGERAIELVKDDLNASSMAKKLLSTSLSSHKCQDNVTVVVVSLNQRKKE